MKIKKSIERVALIIFLIAMFVCAILSLLSVWDFFDYMALDHVGMVIASSFIVGLASFLIWLVLVVLEIRDKILKSGKSTKE